MTGMYEVILAVDENEERSVSSARAVTDLPAAADEVNVTIVYSFRKNPSGASATRVGSVRAAEDIFEEAGVAFSVADVSGDPADVILEVAEDVDADLVVLGGRRRSPAGKALFGSVTQSVILHADRPVMVAGSYHAEE
jgi:nucleotide-binding universal stress UspA family protein